MQQNILCMHECYGKKCDINSLIPSLIIVFGVRMCLTYKGKYYSLSIRL